MANQQKFIFNQPANVEINPPGHRVEQSKDIIKQVRFEPDSIDQLKELCFQNNITFSDFVRTASEFASAYFNFIPAMLRPDVREIVTTVVKGLSKNF